MSAFPFYKYQGTGNDFIMIDGRAVERAWRPNEIAQLCHRRFGIGADGLIILHPHPHLDFKMQYFNANGAESTMCGNGGRCAARFAADLGLGAGPFHFEAIDGPHQAHLKENGTVALSMQPVPELQNSGTDLLLNTGSPHFIRFAEAIEKEDMVALGRKIRYAPTFQEEGINVNLVEPSPDGLQVRTYERGVEDETYSCGTGVTAAALAAHARLGYLSPVSISTPGGQLKVYFEKTGPAYTSIFLEGPATFVFKGEWA
ncbi:MAG: diaminopimelate epimerase [Schleiferiaceae bacterium]|nr:diaminopimelate epimerase [Schleiferiaceae bacterium]